MLSVMLKNINYVFIHSHKITRIFMKAKMLKNNNLKTGCTLPGIIIFYFFVQRNIERKT